MVQGFEHEFIEWHEWGLKIPHLIGESYILSR